MQFALTAKLLINMHNLNNERAEEIRRVPLMYQVGNEFKLVNEAVAVSGVMLKHWHAIYLAKRAKDLGINLCPLCERGECIRVPPPEAISEKWLHVDSNIFESYKKALTGSEEDIIRLCVGEDIHGFLRTKPDTLRREALVKFSWLLPLYLKDIDVPSPFRVVQHSRNIREVPEKEEKKLQQMQMPYPRSYADGVYGFVSLCDLELIGVSFTCRKQVLDDSERKKRQKAALEAYIPMLTGAFGASLARSLPASKPLEIIAFVSKNAKIGFPAPVHPIYEDCYQHNERIFEGFAKAFDVDVTVFVYGIGQAREVGKFRVITVSNPVDVIVQALRYLGLSVA